jgi:two-component system LytT family response regulator
MDAIRALVVDDEPLARRKLLALLNTAPDVQVVGECRDGAEAIERIRQGEVDLVFLDVQMPEVSGLEVVEAVGPERMPPVVFVTAFDRYAVQAFEVHAVDYLLKPFARERFLATLDRVRARVRAGAHPRAEDSRLAEVIAHLERQRGGLERITVQEDGRVFFLAVDQIAWLESEGNYLRLHAGQASHRVRGTVRAIEARLDVSRFVRISRGALVNLAHVREIQPWFRGELVLLLRDDTRLTVSATFAPRLREAIENPF